jgi:hypothetical protein
VRCTSCRDVNFKFQVGPCGVSLWNLDVGVWGVIGKGM